VEGEDEAKDPMVLMTDAANQLVAVMREGTTVRPDNPELFRAGTVTLTAKLNAISLDGCAEEFKDAFIAMRQAMITRWERLCVINEMLHSGTPLKETSEESIQLAIMLGDAWNNLQEVCRKLGLNVDFKYD